MSRFLSIFLPQIAIEQVRRRTAEPQAPAAVWTSLGNARAIVKVNACARRLGLSPGPTPAAARAMLPSLVLIEWDPKAQAAMLSAILAWSRRFTPLAAPDPPDGLMLDVAGVAHLFNGEEALAQTIEAGLCAQGFSAQVGLADFPELAFALARHAAQPLAPTGLNEKGLNEKALMRLVAPLPLAALRLSEDRIAGLAQSGLRRIGDILHRPRAPLTARWGPDLFGRLDAMLGRAKSSISPVFEAPAYLVERRFADPISRREDIEGTILALASELSAMLERHGEGLRRAQASFFRVDGAVKSLEAGSSRPLRDASVIARLFRERLESLGEEGLDADYGFDLARLSALEVERLDPRQGALASDQLPDLDRDGQEEIADLIDRFGARLGSRRVLRLHPRESHIPENAALALPCAGAGAKAPAIWPHKTPAAAPTRPLRLLERPERIEAMAAVPDGPPLRFRWRRMIHEVAAVEGPERIASEWWKSDDLTRDYFRVEDRQGRRFWLYRQGLYERETSQPLWFMHGLFA